MARALSGPYKSDLNIIADLTTLPELKTDCLNPEIF